MCLVCMWKAWCDFLYRDFFAEIWFHNMLSVYLHNEVNKVTQDSTQRVDTRSISLYFICYLLHTVLLTSIKGVLVCMAFISCTDRDVYLKDEIILQSILWARRYFPCIHCVVQSLFVFCLRLICSLLGLTQNMTCPY